MQQPGAYTAAGVSRPFRSCYPPESGLYLCCGAVPDWMVRRVSFDSDSHYPCHPNEQDTLSSKPGQLAANHDLGGDNGSRNVAAIFSDWRVVGTGTTSLQLLATLTTDLTGVCRLDSTGEGLAGAQAMDLKFEGLS